MTTIGELNRRIEILQQEDVRDSYGGEVGEWLTIAMVWAKIEPKTGRESLVGDKVQSSQELSITMRYNSSLTVLHRLKYKDTIYEITAVKDSVTAHRWTEVTAKEVRCGV